MSHPGKGRFDRYLRRILDYERTCWTEIVNYICNKSTAGSTHHFSNGSDPATHSPDRYPASATVELPLVFAVEGCTRGETVGRQSAMLLSPAKIWTVRWSGASHGKRVVVVEARNRRSALGPKSKLPVVHRSPSRHVPKATTIWLASAHTRSRGNRTCEPLGVSLCKAVRRRTALFGRRGVSRFPVSPFSALRKSTTVELTFPADTLVSCASFWVASTLGCPSPFHACEHVQVFPMLVPASRTACVGAEGWTLDETLVSYGT